MTAQQGPQHPQSPPQPPAPGTPGGSGGARGLWDGAVSTPGGRVAVVVAALLGAFVLVAGLGLSAFAIGRHVLGDDDRGHMMSSYRDDPGPGRAPGPGQGNGNGRNKDKGNGPGNGRGLGRGGGDDEWMVPGMPPGQGQGLGQGGFGLGGALHGELTVAGDGGDPMTVVFQVGEVTAYTEGKTLEVKSSDGFSATYTITADTVTTRAAAPAVGATVRVLAEKEGLVLTRLMVVERPQG